MNTSRTRIRPLVRSLHAYVPGEQPKIPGLIKLNTNENPYPPAPAVLKAVRDAVDARLRLYPNSSSQALRQRLARYHRCSPDHIIVGNGSDELLALAVRTFVEPSASHSPKSRTTVQFFHPSYSLYPVLAESHGAFCLPVPLKKGFKLPDVRQLKKGGRWDFRAALTLITTPNAPSGQGFSTRQLGSLCRSQHGVVILDEAYVDFARENAASLALRFPHVLVARTFSKAYSLCFQRVGYFFGPAELIAAMDRMRDSYNVNGLGQVAALATMDQLEYYRRNLKRICCSRDKLTRELQELGFDVHPSQTNFVLVRPPLFPARQWMEKLRERRILVRWFSAPEVSDFLRITIGTEKEVAALIREVRRILGRRNIDRE